MACARPLRRRSFSCVSLLLYGLIFSLIAAPLPGLTGASTSARSASQTPVDRPPRRVQPLQRTATQNAFPNVDDFKRQPQTRPEAAPPIPSNTRAPRKAVSSAGTKLVNNTSAGVRANHAVRALMPQSGTSYAERALARLDLFNQSGNQLRTRDGEWGVPLVSLPGRAGLDLGLGLSYSSMVWTRSGNYIYFDEDKDNLSPGFRLGFPTIEDVFYDSQAGVNARILVTSAGQRLELRQVSTGVFEAADSSYLQLTDNGNNTLTLRTNDGTLIRYAPYTSGWQATKVTDRNGTALAG